MKDSYLGPGPNHTAFLCSQMLLTPNSGFVNLSPTWKSYSCLVPDPMTHLKCLQPMFVTVSPPHAPYLCPRSRLLVLMGVFSNELGGQTASPAPESMATLVGLLLMTKLFLDVGMCVFLLV